MDIRYLIVSILLMIALGIAGVVGFNYAEMDTREKVKAETIRLEELKAQKALADSARDYASQSLKMVTPDLAFHQVKGRVRDIETGHGTIRFDKDGNWTNESEYVSPMFGKLTFHRDKSGFIVRGEMENSPNVLTFEWRYSQLRKIIERDPEGNNVKVYTLSYNDKKLPEHIGVTVNGTLATARQSTAYTYTKFDSRGNWIERTSQSATLGNMRAAQTIVSDSDSVDAQPFEETEEMEGSTRLRTRRNIHYY